MISAFILRNQLEPVVRCVGDHQTLGPHGSRGSDSDQNSRIFRTRFMWCVGQEKVSVQSALRDLCFHGNAAKQNCGGELLNKGLTVEGLLPVCCRSSSSG